MEQELVRVFVGSSHALNWRNCLPVTKALLWVTLCVDLAVFSSPILFSVLSALLSCFALWAWLCEPCVSGSPVDPVWLALLWAQYDCTLDMRCLGSTPTRLKGQTSTNDTVLWIRKSSVKSVGWNSFLFEKKNSLFLLSKTYRIPLLGKLASCCRKLSCLYNGRPLVP